MEGFLVARIASFKPFVPTVNAEKLDAGLLSYFGSLNYDYDSKYAINATVRRDASYRFASTNRWGTFWSVGALWNISEEDFMSDSVFWYLFFGFWYLLFGIWFLLFVKNKKTFLN